MSTSRKKSHPTEDRVCLLLVEDNGTAVVDIWRYEREAREGGYKRVAGVDEAGRGPLAGPVVAAAVILPSDFDPAGIKDSKVMTAKQREAAYQRIICECAAFGIGIVGPDVIDEINILNATHQAACEALSKIGAVDLALVDGYAMKGLPCAQVSVIGGDALSVSISAASIIAKVTRDRMMEEYDQELARLWFRQAQGLWDT